MQENHRKFIVPQLAGYFMLKEHEITFLFLFKQIKLQTPVPAAGAILLLHSLFLLLLV